MDDPDAISSLKEQLFQKLGGAIWDDNKNSEKGQNDKPHGT